MQEIITKILEEAIYAPSGDNSQPWKFSVENESIHIYNLPDRDNEIFNFGQRGSFVAHGAILENICILSKKYGYSTKITLFPEPKNPDHTATVVLAPTSESNINSLTNFIKKRCTNRKKYFNEQISQEQKDQLLLAQKECPFGKFLIIEDDAKKQKIGTAASTAELVMLEYKPLHNAFFSLVSWNKKQEAIKKIGMYVDTLELLPPQKIVFRLFSNWTFDRFLSIFNLPAFVAKENAKIYSASPAIGAIIMEKDSPEDFVNTGRLLQRIWLTSTKLNLSIQPIAGVLYLSRRLNNVGLPGLSTKLQNLITTSVNDIKKCFENPVGNITMVFRLGGAEAPTARATKLPPEIMKYN